jgi:hypothetical protein
MNETNAYAAPESSLELDINEKTGNLTTDLYSQGTWRLLLLTIVTLGIYLAHYMKRQTNILNEHLSASKRISEGLINAIIVLSYVTVLMVVPFFFLEEGHPIEHLSSFGDKILNILTLVWAFKARNRMNSVLKSKAGTNNWFHGLWTFLFQTLYFNYKVNKINEKA